MMAKAAAFDLIAGTDGSFAIEGTAAALKMEPTELAVWFRRNRWTSRCRETGVVLGNQRLINRNFVVQKVTLIPRTDGGDTLGSHVGITPRGMVKVAENFRTDGDLLSPLRKGAK